MTFAAGLRVVERAQSVGNLFNLIELRLIHCVGGVVHDAIGLVVEAGGRFRSGRRKKIRSNSQNGHTQEKFHEHLEAGQGRLNVTYPRRKTQWKMGAVYKRSVNRK